VNVFVSSSLFCFALMQAGTYEQDLLALQYSKKVSLFACDSPAVYSNKSVTIAGGLRSRVINTSLNCELGGEFNTALNLDIFIVLWKKVIQDGDYSKHGWTVKVDPDSVFFPQRLKQIVDGYRESQIGTYINNCKYGLHGPIEVFSRNAVETWSKGIKTCQEYFDEKCSGSCYWGEDLFIDQCFQKVLNVTREENEKLLVEEHCDPPDGWESCEDPTFVSYHPFKDAVEYQGCVDRASEAAAEALP
jgi:hypothetical protein